MADRLLTSSCCVLHLAPTCRCICCRLPFVPRLAAAAAPVEPRPGPRGQAAWWRDRQQQRWQQGDSCGSSRDCWHSRRYFTTQVCSSHWRWQGEALSGGGDARPLQSSSQLMQRGFDFPTPSLANHFVQHRLPACSAPPPPAAVGGRENVGGGCRQRPTAGDLVSVAHNPSQACAWGCALAGQPGRHQSVSPGQPGPHTHIAMVAAPAPAALCCGLLFAALYNCVLTAALHALLRRSPTNSMLSEDPLLSYIKSQLAAPSTRGDGASSQGTLSTTPSARMRALAGVDVQPWAMSFSELEILILIGEGSFGKASGATELACLAAAGAQAGQHPGALPSIPPLQSSPFAHCISCPAGLLWQMARDAGGLQGAAAGERRHQKCQRGAERPLHPFYSA